MELRKSFKFYAGEEVAAHNIFYLQWKAQWLGIIILSGFSSRLCGIDFVCAASFGADIKMSQEYARRLFPPRAISCLRKYERQSNGNTTLAQNSDTISWENLNFKLQHFTSFPLSSTQLNSHRNLNRACNRSHSTKRWEKFKSKP